MSVFGRGRGRGFSKEPALRRPGHTSSVDSDKQDLTNLISSLSLNDTSFESSIDDIVNQIDALDKSNALSDNFNELHNKALIDRNFGKKLAIALTNEKVALKDSTLENVKLKTLLLQTLQNDYEQQEEIRKKNIEGFRNSASFFSEVYHRFKIVDRLFKPLNEPFFHYMKILLENSEDDDIEIVKNQISLSGRLIFEKYPESLEEFLMLIRETLIYRNLSAKSKKNLLYILEIANLGYLPLSGNLQAFYERHIKSSSNDGNIQKNITSNVKQENNSRDKINVQTQNSALTTNNQEILKNSIPLNNDRYDKSATHFIEKPSVPRAIRGVGATNEQLKDNNKNSPKFKNDSNDIWRDVKSSYNKGWSHDDRFEKDY